MVDLAQTIEEWKDIQSIKVDDQVRQQILHFLPFMQPCKNIKHFYIFYLYI